MLIESKHATTARRYLNRIPLSLQAMGEDLFEAGAVLSVQADAEKSVFSAIVENGKTLNW
jgi:hypothetical protein